MGRAKARRGRKLQTSQTTPAEARARLGRGGAFESLSPLTRPWVAALICAAVAALVHANALANGFAYDDVQILVENEALHGVRDLPGALLAPYWPGDWGRELGLWRPGTTVSLALQWTVWQGRALPYHLVNVAMHGLVTGLVVFLIAAIATVPAALFAGLVFAVHPVHVEAVANVVGVAEVQAAALFLAACFVHVRGRLEPGRVADAARSGVASYGVGRLVAVTLLYLGALLTKESAVTLPAALLLLDAARERLGLEDLWSYVRRRWFVYAALLVTAGAVLLMRLVVLGSVARPLAPLGADLLRNGVPRIWTLAGIWTQYARLMVFPLVLSADYSPNVIPIALGWSVRNAAGAVLALSVLGLAWRAWHDRPLGAGSTSARLVGFGLLWFMVTVSPISNVFFLAGVLLAERTLYLPSVGAAAVAGWILARLLQRRTRTTVGLAAGLVLLMGLRTWQRNPTWKDSVAVFETLQRDHPDSGRSQWALADRLYEEGRVPESLHAYGAALGTLGRHSQVAVEVGKKLILARKNRAAQFVLNQAWREDPSYGVAPAYLAVSHFQEGQWADAERFARVSLAIHEDDPMMARVLAESLEEQGRFDEAVQWREAARKDVKVSSFFRLGLLPVDQDAAPAGFLAGELARTRVCARALAGAATLEPDRARAEACQDVILVRSAALEACAALAGPVCDEARSAAPGGRFRFVETAEELWGMEQLLPWTSTPPPPGSVAARLGGGRVSGQVRRGNAKLVVGVEPLLRDRSALAPAETAAGEAVLDSLGLVFPGSRYLVSPAITVHLDLSQPWGGETEYILHFGELLNPADEMIWSTPALQGGAVDARFPASAAVLERLAEGEPVSLTGVKGREAVFTLALAPLGQAQAVGGLLTYMASPEFNRRVNATVGESSRE